MKTTDLIKKLFDGNITQEEWCELFRRSPPDRVRKKLMADSSVNLYCIVHQGDAGLDDFATIGGNPIWVVFFFESSSDAMTLMEMNLQILFDTINRELEELKDPEIYKELLRQAILERGASSMEASVVDYLQQKPFFDTESALRHADQDKDMDSMARLLLSGDFLVKQLGINSVPRRNLATFLIE